MLETFVLTLWLPAFAAALFVLPPEVWHSAPPGLLYLVCAALLGVIGPSGTWAIAESYRKFGPNLARLFREQLKGAIEYDTPTSLECNFGNTLVL